MKSPTKSSRPLVIDADAHVLETEHTWDYLDPEAEKWRPRLFANEGDQRRQYWVINGHMGGFRIPTLTERELESKSAQEGRLVSAPIAARELDDVTLRLRAMDQLGVDVQVLYNSLWLEAVADIPEVEAALCRSWNRWMADVYRQGNGRLLWTCVVPVYDFDVAIEEMRFAKANGAVGLCLRPYEGDLIVSDPHFYPLFDEAVKLNMPIAVHIANGCPELTRLLRTRHETGGAWAAYRVPAILAARSIIVSTVTKDFPTLRWAMVETAASWIPWVCHDLQRRVETPFGPKSNPLLDHNIFVTAQLNDDIPYILNIVGEKVLLIGTDFGHADISAEYDVFSKIRSMDGITETERQSMLSTNPARLYGIDETNAA